MDFVSISTCPFISQYYYNCVPFSNIPENFAGRKTIVGSKVFVSIGNICLLVFTLDYERCHNSYGLTPCLLPTAWVEVNYDSKRHVCICFDGTFPLKCILPPVIVGHFAPHVVTIVCYARILKVNGIINAVPD